MHLKKAAAIGWLCGPALLFSAAAAYGEPSFKALIGRVIVDHCKANVCAWFSIEQTDLVGENGTGSLYRVTVKEWESTHPDGNYDVVTDRRLTRSSDVYAFCSTATPALIFPAADGKWVARMLAPDHASSMPPETEGAYRMYWAMCHGFVLQDLERIGPKLAPLIGYHTRVPAGQDEQTLDGPEAALLW